MGVFFLNIKLWHIAGILFTIIFGTLLHFTYDWSNENPFVAIFSAVNESTWEHLKLIFTPMFLFAILEYFAYGNELDNFIPVKFLSIVLGMFTIVATFYTYVGIIGINYLWADIATFILGTIVAYLFSYKMLQTDCLTSNLANLIGFLGLLLLLICFILFTFNPPQIPLFQDPVTLNYGI